MTQGSWGTPPPPFSPDLGIPGVQDPVEIGRGGFGTVYRARQPEFNRAVAVKVLGVSLDQEARGRFQRELQAMGTLSGHPHIVTVYHAGFADRGAPYIVMEFEGRGSLMEQLRSRGRLPWQEVVAIGVKMSGALEAAHRAGVLHRDIKPENILVSGYGQPKLADFGIARMEGAAHTRTGVITASVPHAAPEILSGARPSVASDVYALASTLYTLVNGSPAFVAPTDESIVPVITRITTQPVPNLRGLGVPDAVCRALEWAMAKNPQERPRTAMDFGRILQQAQSACGIPVTDLVSEDGGGAPAGFTPMAPGQPAPMGAPAGYAPPGAAMAAQPTMATSGYGGPPPPGPRSGMSPGAVWGVIGGLVAAVAVVIIIVVAASHGGGSSSTSTSVASNSPTPSPAPRSLHDMLLTTGNVRGAGPFAIPSGASQIGTWECGKSNRMADETTQAGFTTVDGQEVVDQVARYKSGDAERLMSDIRSDSQSCAERGADQPSATLRLGDDVVRVVFTVTNTSGMPLSFDAIYVRVGENVNLVLNTGDHSNTVDHDVTVALAKQATQRLGGH